MLKLVIGFWLAGTICLARQGTAAPHRRLLQADITAVATAAELREAVQAGRQHIRIVADVDLRSDPAPGDSPTALVVNGTESIVGACATGTDAAAGPRLAGQCVVRADGPILDVHSDNLWLHSLLLLLDSPTAAAAAPAQALVRNSRGRLWATAVTVRGAGGGWGGPVFGLAAGNATATYLGNVSISDLGATAAAVEANSSATLDSVWVSGTTAAADRGIVTILAVAGYAPVVLRNWTAPGATAPPFAVLDEDYGSFFSDTAETGLRREGEARTVGEPGAEVPLNPLQDAELAAALKEVPLIDATSEWLRSTQTVASPAPRAADPGSGSPRPPAVAAAWLAPLVCGASLLLVILAGLTWRYRRRAARGALSGAWVANVRLSPQPSLDPSLYLVGSGGAAESKGVSVGDNAAAALSTQFFSAADPQIAEAPQELSVHEPSVPDSDAQHSMPEDEGGADTPAGPHAAVRPPRDLQEAAAALEQGSGQLHIRRYTIWVGALDRLLSAEESDCVAADVVVEAAVGDTLKLERGQMEEYVVLPPAAPGDRASLRAFVSRAAFDAHCSMHVRDRRHSACCLAPLYVVHVPDDDTVLAQRGQHGAAQQRLRSMYMTLTMKTDPEVPVDTGGQPQAEHPGLSGVKRILHLQKVLELMQRLHGDGGLALLDLSPASFRYAAKPYLRTCAAAKRIGAHGEPGELFSLPALEAARRHARTPLLFTAPEILSAAGRGDAEMVATAAADRWSLGVLALQRLARGGALPAALGAALQPLLADDADSEADRVRAMAGASEPYPWEAAFPGTCSDAGDRAVGGTPHGEHAVLPDLPDLRVALSLLHRNPERRASIGECMGVLKASVSGE